VPGNTNDINQQLADVKNDLNRIINTFAPGGDPVIRAKAKIYAADAIRNYDPKSGTKLRTYLYSQLQKLKQDAAASTMPVTLPYKRFALTKQLAQDEGDLRAELGRDPTEFELADRLGISTRRLRNLRSASVKVAPEVSLTDEEGEPVESGVESSVPVDAALEATKMSLEPLNQKILEKLLEGKKYTQIAKELKISPAAITYRLEFIRNMLRQTYEAI